MGGYFFFVKKKNEKLFDLFFCVIFYYGFEIGLRNFLDSFIKI